jgi:serine-type D-Ala-D-Ala endopeptidase (penicillin-binding protein 7)
VRLLPLLAVTAIALPSLAHARNVPALTKDGLPNVQSAGAIVVDAATGAVLYEKNADEVRHIASTGKIIVALVVRERGLDLEALTEIDEVDKKYARGGARTRLWEGHKFRNIDLMRAMLIASDNRACTALGRAVGLDPDALIAAMNDKAAELGLTSTRFSDPSGLRGNESTPREMALALRAALADPLIAEIMGTEEVTVDSVHAKARRIHYVNTNRSLRNGRRVVVGGKTGYTDAARYCLVIAAKVDGREVYMSFLGAEGKLTRFADFSRVAQWMEEGGAPTVNTANLAPSALTAGEL